MNDVEWHGNKIERLQDVGIMMDAPLADPNKSNHRYPFTKTPEQTPLNGQSNEIDRRMNVLVTCTLVIGI